MIHRRPLAQLESLLKNGGLVLLNGNRDDHKAFYLKAIAYALRGQFPQGPASFSAWDEWMNLHKPTLFEDLTASSVSKAVYGELSALKDKELEPCLASITEAPERPLLIAQTSWTTKSKSYQYCEGKKQALIFPCYGLELNDYLSYIKGLLATEGVSISGTGAMALASMFLEQPALIFQELEKLKLFQGDSQVPLDAETIEILCASKTSLKLDELLAAFLSKDMARLIPLLEVDLLAENSIAIVRLMARQMMQLLELFSLQKKGVEPAQAWMQIFYPVFYKMQPVFARALHTWSEDQAASTLYRLTILEKDIKESTLDGESIQGNIVSLLHTIN